MTENYKGNKLSMFILSCVPVGELKVGKCSVEAGKRVEGWGEFGSQEPKELDGRNSPMCRIASEWLL